MTTDQLIASALPFAISSLLTAGAIVCMYQLGMLSARLEQLPRNLITARVRIKNKMFKIGAILALNLLMIALLLTARASFADDKVPPLDAPHTESTTELARKPYKNNRDDLIHDDCTLQATTNNTRHAGRNQNLISGITLP